MELNPRLACFWLFFSALLTGVMAETLDSDLIGAIVAAVCVVVLAVLIVVFIACCCYRRLESKRKSLALRKESNTVSANGASMSGTPRMVPQGMPMLYAVPASQYYLGHHEPKFLDVEALEYMRQHPDTSSHRTRGEEREQHERREATEMTSQGETPGLVYVEATQQANGQVPHDFIDSSVNYKVIRKQHKHEMMPEWLRKSYEENERSIDLDDEDSKTSSIRSNIQQDTAPPPEQIARIQVSPHHTIQDPENVSRVPHDFTLVDFVDPKERPRSSDFLDKDEDHAVITTTTYIPTTSDETTTHDNSQVKIPEADYSSEDTRVLSVFTSSHREHPESEIQVGGEEGGDDSEEGHYRMRKAGLGSIPDLPEAAKETEVLF